MPACLLLPMYCCILPLWLRRPHEGTVLFVIFRAFGLFRELHRLAMVHPEGGDTQTTPPR